MINQDVHVLYVRMREGVKIVKSLCADTMQMQCGV